MINLILIHSLIHSITFQDLDEWENDAEYFAAREFERNFLFNGHLIQISTYKQQLKMLLEKITYILKK